MEIKYSGLESLSHFLAKCRTTFASLTHTHTKSEITDFPTIPTKTSQLTNDSGFKTTDNNTTYSLSKSGDTITLTGSDGSSTSVTDSDTTYGAAGTSFGLVKSGGDVTITDGVITVTDDSHAHIIANVDGLQATLDNKSNDGHKHTVSEISDLTVTASELNCMTGVTSSVQTQLNTLHNNVLQNETSISTAKQEAMDYADQYKNQNAYGIVKITNTTSTYASSPEDPNDGEVTTYLEADSEADTIHFLSDTPGLVKLNLQSAGGEACLHIDVYADPEGSADAVLEEAKAYTDEQVNTIQEQLDSKASTSSLSNYYTKAEIDEMEFITTDDIDTICGTTIEDVSINEVTF